MNLSEQKQTFDWRIGDVVQSFLRTFLPAHLISWQATVLPIEEFGNAEDGKQKKLAKLWAQMMLRQLSDVEIIVSWSSK